MIRGFVYGFFFGLIFNILGILFIGILNIECIYFETIAREEREIRTIGSLAGFLCSCIAIGWLVYCFKF
jgi:Na+/proline symporter